MKPYMTLSNPMSAYERIPPRYDMLTYEANFRIIYLPILSRHLPVQS